MRGRSVPVYACRDIVIVQFHLFRLSGAPSLCLSVECAPRKFWSKKQHRTLQTSICGIQAPPCFYRTRLLHLHSMMHKSSKDRYILQDTASTSLLLYPCDVGLADRVPGGHVLFHALSVAGRLAGRERGAGLGDAALETVLV